MIEVAPTNIADPENSEFKFNVADGDNLMFVDVAKLIDLPQGMSFKSWPAMIRLKRLDDFESLRQYTSNLLIETLISGFRAFGINRESSQSSRLVCGQQCELPSKMVEAGANTVGKFTEQYTDWIRGDVLLNANDVPQLLNVVISPFGIGLALNK